MKLDNYAAIARCNICGKTVFQCMIWTRTDFKAPKMPMCNHIKVDTVRPTKSTGKEKRHDLR